MESIFTSWGDGMKNYFTLLSYVKEPIGKEGIFKYNAFYGTDNTIAIFKPRFVESTGRK